jgi:sugar phosphate isomerase/epimerase
VNFLSAFGDEIAPALDDQIEVLISEDIHHLDLRTVDETNVLDLTTAQAEGIKERLDEAGITVTAIDTAIGKVPVDVPIDEELARLDRAIEMARLFMTPAIRIFSYYKPATDPQMDKAGYRNMVLGNFMALTARAEEEQDVLLLLENDLDLYGDTVARMSDVLESVGSARLAAILDPANFLLAGEWPYPDAYEALKAKLGAVHVKDAKAWSRRCRGRRRAHFPELLRHMKTDDYEGVFSLEPHLETAGQLKGFSGPERFRHAASAFKKLLADFEWEYA